MRSEGARRRGAASLPWWKRPLRFGLGARLAVMTSALVVAVCTTLSWILVQHNLDEVRRRVMQRAGETGAYLATEAELSMLSGDVLSLRQQARRARSGPDVLYCRFFDRDGSLLAEAGEVPRGPAPPAPGADGPVGPVAVAPDVWEFRTPVLTTDARPRREEIEFIDGPHAPRPRGAARLRIGTVALGVSLASLHELRERVLVTAALFTALVTLIGVVAVTAGSKAITRPLQALAQAAHTIARGDLTTTVAVRTTDEVGDVAESFNVMVDSLARSRAALEEHSRTLEEKVRARTERLEVLNRELQQANHLKSEFLATVSHELRTPLNVIIGYTEMLADGCGGAVTDAQRQMIEAVERYSRLQLDLITSVLDFARLDSGKVSLRVERFRLGPFLEEVYQLYRTRVVPHVAFTLVAAPDLALRTDRMKLQTIVRNLVDNAVKFTERGGIVLEAQRSADRRSAVIQVCDSGPGIAPGDLSHIFDPFRQGGQGSTRTTGGVGLGLAIVKQLAEILGGGVSVFSQLGDGAVFRVEIPLELPPRNGQGAAHSLPLPAESAGRGLG